MIDEERDPDVYEAMGILEMLSTLLLLDAIPCFDVDQTVFFVALSFLAQSRSFMLDRCPRL